MNSIFSVFRKQNCDRQVGWEEVDSHLGTIFLPSAKQEGMLFHLSGQYCNLNSVI